MFFIDWISTTSLAFLFTHNRNQWGVYSLHTSEVWHLICICSLYLSQPCSICILAIEHMFSRHPGSMMWSQPSLEFLGPSSSNSVHILVCWCLLAISSGVILSNRYVFFLCVVVVCCWLLVVGCLLLVVCCLLFVVCWLLVVGCWLLVVGCWLLVVDCWLVVGGCWLLVVGCWLVVVGCWLLVVGCWLLVVGCWLWLLMLLLWWLLLLLVLVLVFVVGVGVGVCCCLLLFVGVCWCLLLFVVVVCCCLLLFVVVCAYGWKTEPAFCMFLCLSWG